MIPCLTKSHLEWFAPSIDRDHNNRRWTRAETCSYEPISRPRQSYYEREGNANGIENQVEEE